MFSMFSSGKKKQEKSDHSVRTGAVKHPFGMWGHYFESLCHYIWYCNEISQKYDLNYIFSFKISTNVYLKYQK